MLVADPHTDSNKFDQHYMELGHYEVTPDDRAKMQSEVTTRRQPCPQSCTSLKGTHWCWTGHLDIPPLLLPNTQFGSLGGLTHD